MHISQKIRTGWRHCLKKSLIKLSFLRSVSGDIGHCGTGCGDTGTKPVEDEFS